MKSANNRPVLASRGNRIVAKLIDTALFVLPTLLIFFILRPNISEKNYAIFSVWGGLLLVVYLAFILSMQSSLLLTYGQTLGKRFMKIRVVDMDTLSIPNFPRLIMLRSVLSLYLTFTLLYPLLNFISLLLPKRRCLHDFMANSIVIKADSQFHHFTQASSKTSLYVLSISPLIAFCSLIIASVSIGSGMESSIFLGSLLTLACFFLFTPYAVYRLYRLSTPLEQGMVKFFGKMSFRFPLFILLSVIMIGFSVMGLIRPNPSTYLGEGISIFILISGASLTILLLSIIYTLYKNLTYLKIKTITTPAMAMALFIVPLISLLMPYKIWGEFQKKLNAKLFKGDILLWMIVFDLRWILPRIADIESENAFLQNLNIYQYTALFSLEILFSILTFAMLLKVFKAQQKILSQSKKLEHE